MDDMSGKREGRTQTALLLLTIGMIAWAATACDSLLEVELPTRVPAESLDDPAMAEVLVNSAVADFECAFANYIVATGMLTDELWDSTGWIAVTVWNQRRIPANHAALNSTSCTATGPGVGRPLHTALRQAEDARERLAGWSDDETPNRARLQAVASAYSGYSHILIGESFCETAIMEGPLMEPPEVLSIAEARFGEAMDFAQAAGDEALVNLARVGRARANLNLGNLAAAAEYAEGVAEGFVHYATYSGATTRRRNRVYWDNHREFWISVAPEFQGLEVDGVPDPRVPTEAGGRLGHDGSTDVWLQLKYTSESDQIPIATWEEAQLIIAESRGGQEAVDAINRVRGSHDLPTFSSDDAGAISAQVLEERRRQLYLQGHRLNDILRNPALEFPQGETQKGVPFGSTTCLPLPQSERDGNPNLAS